MDNDEDKLESVNLQASPVVERVLVKVGRELHRALIDAERYDEVAALGELIGEYTLVASYYGDKTGRLPEDLGIDLNEAAMFKEDDLKENGTITKSTWKQFADGAIRHINAAATDLVLLNVDEVHDRLNASGKHSKQAAGTIIAAFLDECGQALRGTPERARDISYAIAGLMSTPYAAALDDSHPVSEIMTIAGELETLPDNKSELLHELLSRIDDLEL